MTNVAWSALLLVHQLAATWYITNVAWSAMLLVHQLAATYLYSTIMIIINHLSRRNDN